MKSENCKLDGLLAVLVLKIGEGRILPCMYLILDYIFGKGGSRWQKEHSNDKKSANLKKTAPSNSLYRQMLTISCSFETGIEGTETSYRH